MITNYFNFNVNNKNVKLREISFYEFKNICKKILTDDIHELNNIFNEIIDATTKSESLNCLEKFQCLMILRNLIYGKDFNFIYEDKKINTDLTLLTNNVKFDVPDVVVETNNMVFNFNTPSNFYNDSIDGLLIDCLKKITIKDRDIDCSQLPFNQKKQLLNDLSLPIYDTYSKLKTQLKDLNITFYKDATINIYDGSLLYFLKRVFQEDMMNLYTFEYACIRGLRLSALDMERYTYPELKIFLQELTREMKKNTPQQSGIDLDP